MRLEPTDCFSARRWSPAGNRLRPELRSAIDGDQASGRKVWANTFRARSDKVIAVGRILLAAGSVWIVWLDSVHVPLPPEPIYFLLTVYLFYAVAAAFLVWRTDISRVRGTLVRHVIDVAALTTFMSMTDGPASPFFMFMPFTLLSATLHWRWRGALYTGLVCLAALLYLGYFDTNELLDPDSDTTTNASRLLFIFVAAVLLVWLGAHQEAVRAELLRLVQRTPAQPRGREWPVRTALDYAAHVMLVPRALLLWTDAEEPWTYAALWNKGELEVVQMSPDAFGSWTDERLLYSSLLITEAAAGRLLIHTGEGRFHRWTDPEPPISPALVEAFKINSAVSTFFQVDDLQARLFVLEPPALTLDDVAITEIIADRIKALFEQAILVRQLSDEAAVNERIRIGRDLHDGVLQALAGTALHLQSLRKLTDVRPEVLAERLDTIQAMLQDEQRELRGFIRALEPGGNLRATDEMSLERQLEALAVRLSQQWQIDISIAFDPPAGIDLPLALTYELARMTSEATANAVRHGGAQTVRIVVRVDAGSIVLTIDDDGIGFGYGGRLDHTELQREKIGPRSLRERAAARGGKLAIERIAEWTRVIVMLPMPQ
ncbi:sensor histidine kinase [Ensifer adhaerens]|uniref:sensor histidine kinase n=1 Tax=Ensifer adhaerens TaxID=106592 RepID=UPI000CF1B734|nr:sensor histidine kinase [Ensifer adhaerens]